MPSLTLSFSAGLLAEERPAAMDELIETFGFEKRIFNEIYNPGVQCGTLLPTPATPPAQSLPWTAATLSNFIPLFRSVEKRIGKGE